MKQDLETYTRSAMRAIRERANELGRREMPLLYAELYDIGCKAIDNLYRRGIEKRRIFSFNLTKEQKEELESIHVCVRDSLGDFIEKTIISVNKRRNRLNIKKSYAAAVIEGAMESAGLTYSFECTGNGIRLYVKLVKNKMVVLHLGYKDVATQVKEVKETVDKLNYMYSLYGANSRIAKSNPSVQWKCSI